MLQAQVHTWPKFIGGPAHGQHVPFLDRNAVFYSEEGSDDVIVYRDAKIRFGQIAIRAFVFGGPSRDVLLEVHQEIAIHALAQVGVKVDERDESEMH